VVNRRDSWIWIDRSRDISCPWRGHKGPG
jgi:hypothetical protein